MENTYENNLRVFINNNVKLRFYFLKLSLTQFFTTDMQVRV